jgi:TRAP-type C4-dicarboxylate transport system permease small subunit
MLDRAGALLLGASMALLAWRAAIGGWNAWSSKSGSMMLGFPEWIVYACIVPPLVLCTVIGLAQAAFGLERVRA